MTDYIVGDIVWAKLTGYPWWPAKIEDEKNLTKRVLAAKPKTSSPVWPVKFFATFDYGWFGQECLCSFEKGLGEYGNLNRRGNQFALAVEQAKGPQDTEDSDEALISKKPAKRPTRPGSNGTSKINKRSASVAPKEKKAKIEKVSNDNANSELSNSSNTSPIHQSDSKRTRPVLSRSSKDSATDKPQKSEDEMEVEPQPKTETVVEANPRSSPAPAETPVSPDSSSSRLAAKTKKPESLDDVTTMRTLRAALQKATVIEKFKNQETINGLLCTLEEGVFSPECLIATKMQKLMRHLYAHPIPKNDFKFKDRFRLLAIRFKALETKLLGAGSAVKEADAPKQPHKKDEPADTDKPGTPISSLDKKPSSAADTETKKDDSNQTDKKDSQSTDKSENPDTSSQDKSEKTEPTPDTAAEEKEVDKEIEPTPDTAAEEKEVDKEILSLVSDRQSDEETDQPKDTQEKNDLSTSVDKDSGADETPVESKPSNLEESTELPNTNGNQNCVEGSDDSAAKHDDPPSNDHIEDKASSQISSNEQSCASHDSPRPEDKDDGMEDTPAKKSSLNINDSPIKPTTESVSDTLVNP